MTMLRQLSVAALGSIALSWTVLRRLPQHDHAETVLTVTAVVELLAGALALWHGVRWHGVAAPAATAIALGAVAIALAPMFWITGMDGIGLRATGFASASASRQRSFSPPKREARRP